MTDDYFIGVHGRELERLQAQHAAWAPETRSLWSRAGFGPGQRIADLGSGPGFSALELSEVVGSSGSVTAIDKATPYLDFLGAETRRRGLANVRAVESDLLSIDALESAPLDGAFCRFLLAFLIADLDRVLGAIYRSLRPGGVFAAMEYLTLRSATASPPMRGFDAHTNAWIEYYLKHGGDTAVGTALPQRLAQAGFELTHAHCVGGMAGPAHRWWAWWGRLITDFGDTLASDGYMTREALRQLQDDWAQRSQQDDAFIYTPVLVQLVAKKPG
jgi:ubiquinone/menaquinone biosynthesis C-methylase UbiE